MGCVLPAGQGQAPARQAALGAGLPLVDRLHHGEQDVRLRHEGRDARARHPARRQRSTSWWRAAWNRMTNAPYLLPKARAGLRMGHGQVIDHMFYDGLEDAYDKGRLMGTFAEECARQVQLHPRSAGRLRDRRRSNGRRRRTSDGCVRLGNHADRDQGRQGREVHRDGRAAVQGEPREDPDAQARLPQGRHGDRGEFELDLRRRRGAGADAPLDAPRSAASRRSRRSSATRRTRRSPRWFTTAPVGAIRKLLEKTGWKAERRRPLRDQRSLRGGDHGGDEGARPAARQGQRARRRLRARPPDRRLRRAHPRDADRRAAQARRQARRRDRCASAAAKPRRWRSSWHE